MSLPHAATAVDAPTLADELARFRVVESGRLAALLGEFPGGGPAVLVAFLVQRGALTLFQAERALAGEAQTLALGPYRLTGQTGGGTLGPLFVAVHTVKPGSFAVRVLPLRSLWKARQAKQLSRTLAANVTHPGVVPLVDVDSANGFHYLVWPETEGDRLTDRVNAAGPLPPGEAAALLGHLAGALAACHARGTVHGALTPRAVALTASGLPRLLELGTGALLAQNVADDESLFDSMSAAFASAGVLTFAAPELATDPQTLTAAADQYALGAVGYFAVTGLPPFPHPTLDEELRAKRAGTPPSAAVVNPAVSEEFAAVLERMMAPNPADRFASLGEVETRLAELASSEPAPPPEPPQIESLRLSRLMEVQRGSDAVSWAPSRSEPARPPERDGSDASVSFDLPDAAPEEPPESVVATPGPISGFGRMYADQPSLAAVETPRNYEFPGPTVPAPVPPLDQQDGSVEAPAPAELGGKTADPRLSAPTPVQWHPTEAPESDPTDPSDDPAPTPSVLWRKVKRNLMFWKEPTDPVQVSVFGPAAATPGQMIKLAIYVHTPDAVANVRTLSRAFQHDSELLGTGHLAQEVKRAAELVVHLSVANAGVARTQVTFEWRGQPHRSNFELHVPWESPEGISPGLVSVGLDDVRIGRIEFRLHVLPRKA
jgi:serine/threonine protein kinase